MLLLVLLFDFPFTYFMFLLFLFVFIDVIGVKKEISLDATIGLSATNAQLLLFSGSLRSSLIFIYQTVVQRIMLLKGIVKLFTIRVIFLGKEIGITLTLFLMERQKKKGCRH